MDYELLVIGDERMGLECALTSARRGRRTAMVTIRDTIPTLETMNLAAFNISEDCEITMDAWRSEVTRLNQCHWKQIDAELESARIEQFFGHARFTSPTTIEIWGSEERRMIASQETVIAIGTRPWLPASFHVDTRFVFTTDMLLQLKEIPRSTIIVGGGETGITAAIMLASLGVEVTVVDEQVSHLELCGFLERHFDAAQSLEIAFRLNSEVIGTELRPNSQVAVRLGNGRLLEADTILVCVGRQGKTDNMNLENVGVGIDERGRVWSGDDGQTWESTIFAVGSVAGSPRANTTRKRPKGIGLTPRIRFKKTARSVVQD